MKTAPVIAAFVLAAVVLHPSSLDAQRAPMPDDPTIIAIFDAANTRDIEHGQLAIERGTTQAVRDFGAMLVRDHEHVRQLGRDLATKLHVTPTPPSDQRADRDQVQAMQMLRSRKGEAFDTAFARFERDYHNKVIDEIHETLLPAIKNPELRALVVQVAPAFKAHMLGAEALLERLTSGR
jgi:putative membrane protein